MEEIHPWQVISPAPVARTPFMDGCAHPWQDLAGRWAVVENEARSLVRGLSSTNLILRQGLCKDAVQAYNVSRELVKQKEHSHLLPHVEAMRRLKKTRRRVKEVTEVAPKRERLTPTPEQ